MRLIAQIAITFTPFVAGGAVDRFLQANLKTRSAR